jgi:hypothetical protein
MAPATADLWDEYGDILFSDDDGIVVKTTP